MIKAQITPNTKEFAKYAVLSDDRKLDISIQPKSCTKGPIKAINKKTIDKMVWKIAYLLLIGIILSADFNESDLWFCETFSRIKTTIAITSKTMLNLAPPIKSCRPYQVE